MPSNIEVVLVNPEIPQNTGNIMRTCVGLNIKLHLIKPMGFTIDNTKLKRSAVDYYEKINYEEHNSLEDFFKTNPGKYYFLTRYGKKSYHEIDFQTNEKIYLFFGSESYGIDRTLLKNNIDKTFRIPSNSNIRSLNLSNSVAIVLYEAMRQQNFKGLSLLEPNELKGENYLDQFEGETDERK